jgi:hypothetical protein
MRSSHTIHHIHTKSEGSEVLSRLSAKGLPQTYEEWAEIHPKRPHYQRTAGHPTID